MDTLIVYMTIDRFWVLLSKRVFAEASQAELKELEEILLEHPDWKNSSEALEILGRQSHTFENNIEADKAFEAHIERMKKADIEFNQAALNYPETEVKEKNNKRDSTKWWFSGGIVALNILCFFIFNNINTPEKRISGQSTLSRVTTKPGSKTQIQLPDGSTVWLNASTNLTYGKNFGKKLREVNLTGEAFFDVMKDSSHPFIIHTNVIDIKVLGTAFNVRSYPNDANTETSLIRGKVEVTVKNRSNEKVWLEPNEKLVVANKIMPDNTISYKISKKETAEKPLYSIQHLTYYPVDSAVIETSWVDNRLLFQSNETFKEVALKMERWYAVQIIFADEKVANYRPFGSFKNETITQALDALRLGFKFNYKIEGNKIIVTQ